MSRDNLHEEQSPSPNKRKLQELMNTVESVRIPNPNQVLLQQSSHGDGGGNTTVAARAVDCSNLYDQNSEAYFSADSDLTAEQTAGPCSMDEDASKSSNVSGDGGGGKLAIATADESYDNTELGLNLFGTSIPSSPKLQRNRISARAGDSGSHESWLELRLGFSVEGRAKAPVSLPEIKRSSSSGGNNTNGENINLSEAGSEPLPLQLLDCGPPARKALRGSISDTPRRATPPENPVISSHVASAPTLYNYNYVATTPVSAALNAHVSRGVVIGAGDAGLMDQSKLLQHVINNQGAVTGFRRWTPEPVVQDPRMFYHPDQLARLALPPGAGDHRMAATGYLLPAGAAPLPSIFNASSVVPSFVTANDNGAVVQSVTRPVASYHQGLSSAQSGVPSNLTDAGGAGVMAAENSVDWKQRLRHGPLQIANGKRRPEAGVWFSLEAASPVGEDDGRRQDQLQQHFMQNNYNKTYLRIKDGKMQVSVLKRYLATKLQLSADDEVEIMCRGKLLIPTLTIQHVRDHVWLSKEFDASESIGFRSKNGYTCSSKDKVMALCYQIHMQTITLNLLKT